MATDWKWLPVKPNFKAKVDRSDFDRLNEYSWRVVTSPSGRRRVVTNFRQGKRNRQVTLGWMIMRPPKGKMVYARRFMDGFDYRSENLVVCTMKERQRILPKSRNHGSSKYKGVSYDSTKKRWRAAIQKLGKTQFIGLFKTQEEAAVAYNKAAIEAFGTIAYQNQVKVKSGRRKKEE